MLKVKNSDQLGDLDSQRRAKPSAAPVPAPAPTPAMPSLDPLVNAVMSMAIQQRENNEIVRQALQRPRAMECDIQRDADGRATKIIITVTERE